MRPGPAAPAGGRHRCSRSRSYKDSGRCPENRHKGSPDIAWSVKKGLYWTNMSRSRQTRMRMPSAPVALIGTAIRAVVMFVILPVVTVVIIGVADFLMYLIEDQADHIGSQPV